MAGWYVCGVCVQDIRFPDVSQHGQGKTRPHSPVFPHTPIHLQFTQPALSHALPPVPCAVTVLCRSASGELPGCVAAVAQADPLAVPRQGHLTTTSARKTHTEHTDTPQMPIALPSFIYYPLRLDCSAVLPLPLT